MDTNCIIKDGFSNQQTERLFRSWAKEDVSAAIGQNRDCGSCMYRFFLVDSEAEYTWVLCLSDNDLAGRKPRITAGAGGTLITNLTQRRGKPRNRDSNSLCEHVRIAPERGAFLPAAMCNV